MTRFRFVSVWHPSARKDCLCRQFVCSFHFTLDSLFKQDTVWRRLFRETTLFGFDSYVATHKCV